MDTKRLAKKAHLLVVDDKPANLLVMNAVLGSDYELVLAGSGEEAIAELRSRPDIDLILMDVQMPRMDGYEAASRIKQMPGCRDIPIIFITAIYTEDPYVKRGYQVGGVDYFTKPFDPEILKLKVDVYATFRRKAQFLREREQHLRETEKLLQVGRKLASVLESLPVGVLIADTEGMIFQATETVFRIFGAIEQTERDAYGRLLSWWDENGQTLRGSSGPVARALAGQVSHSERLQIACFDGTLKTLVASASPLRGLDGQIVGAVVLLQDVTEKKQIEEALEERVTRLISLGVELEETAHT